MCCTQCTIAGMATSYGQKIYNDTPPDWRWRYEDYCPKMSDKPLTPYLKYPVKWGICRATRELKKVECCVQCDYFT